MESHLDLTKLSEASTLSVFDAAGNVTEFASLYRGQKTIVVFIRHFFCGSCQQYVMRLSAVPKDALKQAGARLVVIGCGDWHLIKDYCVTTGFQGDMYADPSRNLYKCFDLTESLDRTPAGKEKRSYLADQTFLGNVVKSIWEGPIKKPQHIGKQGKISQLGGDFIFGPGDECSFASCMKHTEDHVEVADLMRHAGVSCA